MSNRDLATDDEMVVNLRTMARSNAVASDTSMMLLAAAERILQERQLKQESLKRDEVVQRMAELEDALSDIERLVNFAYEWGAHELGYNPITTVRQLFASVETMHGYAIDAANKGDMARSNADAMQQCITELESLLSTYRSERAAEVEPVHAQPPESIVNGQG